MSIRIALAGNPNCGKTTLFNALTGLNQFVGNWPGVTVEKKEGKLKKHEGVIVTDLPGIYSLSPYTLEEVVARNYLIGERPDVILNLVDATNIERNLYLTTQLTEIGIPVVIALNMMDLVRKNGDKIDTNELSKQLGCSIMEISALKGDGIMEAAEEAIKKAQEGKKVPHHTFLGPVEHAIAHIEEATLHDLPEDMQRWYAVKIFERDHKVLADLKISQETVDHIEEDIVKTETELDDDAESIITNERYEYVAKVLKNSYKKRQIGLSTSDKIDLVVTNRYLALPIFALIMFLVYFISVTTVGAWASGWVNDGLFGDGWHLFGIGSKKYERVIDDYDYASQVLDGYLSVAETNGMDITAIKSALDTESETFSVETAKTQLDNFYATIKNDALYEEISYEVIDEETLVSQTVTSTIVDFHKSIETLYSEFEYVEPDPADYGVWVPGIPVLIEDGLNKIGCWDWLQGLVLDGIVVGVGSVLGFLPQIFVLFIFLAFLEACGYMARIAFVLDRIFRKFGLSGKSFIPLLIGTGCGVPGIMASRTIENERDRRMTVITTTFIPCGAKLPFIAMIAGVIFGGAWWVAPSAYFIGIIAVVVSGIILKKTKLFAGEVSPFIMELPTYHMPTFKNVMKCTWDRTWSFIKKAGSIILISSVVLWFASNYGFVDGTFKLLSEEEMQYGLLAKIGGAIAWIFKPLGFGTWQATVSSITGIIAKENIVGSLSIFYGLQGVGSAFTKVSAYSFLIFNILCAPCFAAIGAIRREMNSAKWTWFAIGYQCGFAYVIAFIYNSLGNLFTGRASGVTGVICSILAFLFIAGIVFLLARPNKANSEK